MFVNGKPKYKNGQVSVSVKNVGARYGQETVQVYLRNLNDPDGKITVAIK